MDLSTENVKHSQLSAAKESLQHIFSVPDIVRRTDEHINDGKLLLAHRGLADLEASRDQLMFELHKQGGGSNSSDAQLLQGYFSEVSKLSEALGKQLWLILQRTLITVRRDPTIIVAALRIIEREERTDDAWLKRKDITGFCPIGRPKRWKEKCMNILSDAIETKLEGCQLEQRAENKMWLVRHLEIIRRNTIDDLKVIKELCGPCFPPHYQIVKNYVKMYHTAISQHLLRLVEDPGLEGNEIVSLLSWIGGYYGPELMGHPGLAIEEGELGPLLSAEFVEQLEEAYLMTMRSNVKDWLAKSIDAERKDWSTSEKPPDADASGHYNTHMAMIVFQMIEQNLQVATGIGDGTLLKVVNLFLEELCLFATTYSGELQIYHDKHLEDRKQPPFYLHYMIANINGCATLADLAKTSLAKYLKSDSPSGAASAPVKAYQKISEEQGLLYLKEEVFTDIEQSVSNLITRSWLESDVHIETICITIEDYCEDLVHLRRPFFAQLMAMIYEQLIIAYVRQLVSPSRKIKFDPQNYKERKTAGEKIVKDSDHLYKTFKKLQKEGEQLQTEQLREVLPALAEVIKMQDTTLMSLEISGILHKFPDIKDDHIINLLQLRGDTSRAEAKQMMDSNVQRPPINRQTIMSKV